MRLSKILVVDDEASICKMLQTGLRSYGYDVITVSSGIEAIKSVIGQNPDVVILDVNLNSYPDGVETCRQLREFSAVPILMLSVENDKETKIAALNAGADDYINKPFYIDELEARIRAVSRRGGSSSSVEETEIQVKDLRIDFVSRRVFVKDTEVHLTKTEYKLLRLLAIQHGKILTHTMIIKDIWGGEREEHFVHVFVNTLRKKIGEDYIVTITGVGYRFIDL